MIMNVITEVTIRTRNADYLAMIRDEALKAGFDIDVRAPRSLFFGAASITIIAPANATRRHYDALEDIVQAYA